MSADDSNENIPTWLFVLIGVGLGAPVCLVLAMAMRPSPPTAAEREVAQQVAEREAAVAEQRERDVAQERAAARQALRDRRSRAGIEAVECLWWGGAFGLVLGISTLFKTAYTTQHDVWYGTKIGDQKVTKSVSRMNCTTTGILALFWMPAVGATLAYVATFIYFFCR